jgi:hypothetical protein
MLGSGMFTRVCMPCSSPANWSVGAGQGNVGRLTRLGLQEHLLRSAVGWIDTDGKLLDVVATPAIPAGGAVQVSLQSNTAGVKTNAGNTPYWRQEADLNFEIEFRARAEAIYAVRRVLPR